MSSQSGTRKDPRNPAQRKRLRVTVASRLMLVLAATAALSAALAMGLHDRALAADLNRAAQDRLARASQATNRLVEGHLQAIRERYRAISGTPQLRANLEVAHAPTLTYYAQTLGIREGAELLAFFDRDGQAMAVVGDEKLLAAAGAVETEDLVAAAGHAYAVVSVDLHTSAGRVGRLLAAERVEAETLARWSDLTGVEVSLDAPGSGDPDALRRATRSLGELDLFVTASLASEHDALRRSRTNLIFAGSLAIGLSLLACALLARGFVRPILGIQHAADRIRRGDLDVRLASERQDEIGDVARAFDLMLDGLGESRREIERHVAELRSSQSQLAKAQEMARLGSFELDYEKGEVSELRGSDQLLSLLGTAPGVGPIDPETLLERVHPDDREGLVSAVLETFEGGVAMRSDLRIRLPDGSERIIHAQAQLLRTASGEPARLEGTAQDVTDRRRADEQIRYLAHHDGLTGLGNRRLFAERLQIAITQAGRRGLQLGVLHLDLDRFKIINDTLGQTVGDEALRRVADRLVRATRVADVVVRSDSNTAVSRLAGDEFILLVGGIGNPQELALVAERVLELLSQPLQLEGHELVFAGSIGIAAWPTDGRDGDALLRSASSAMQHAKERGGGHFRFYDDSMNASATEFLEIEAGVRRGLARGEFELHYQPKVRLSDGRVSGYEALMRWRDPEAGLVTPNVFIPVAERCGLILPLGEFALQEACRQLVAWQSERPEGDIPKIAVNLSAHQFRSGNLVQTVAATLEASGAAPEQLELEITETAVLHHEKDVVAQLEQLRGMGIAIALDDFGTGQSSLSHMRRLPVDTLKIDMSFVRNIEHSEAEAGVTAAIVAMGHARSLRVVAEGVETEGQRERLATWGCDEIQGYLISRALPPEEAIRFAYAPGDPCGDPAPSRRR